MPTTDAITRRLDTATDLRAIVRTMKALAAANIRQYSEAVVSLADCARTVELGFQMLFRVQPERLARPSFQPQPARTGAVVIGSDHGLCGAFNEQIAAFALEHRGAQADRAHVIVVGQRAAARLEDSGQPPAATFALPASVVRIAALVQEVLELVAAWRAADAVEGIRLYFNAPHGQAGHAPREELLLPIDEVRLRQIVATPWRPRAVPTIAGDWDVLFAAVVGQHLFVTLHRAIALSLAAENASRLSAMHAADRNIEDRLHALRGQYHRERQAAITTELLDIVSGYESLSGGIPADGVSARPR